MKLHQKVAFMCGLGYLPLAAAVMQPTVPRVFPVPPAVAVGPGYPFIPHFPSTDSLVDAFKYGTPDLNFRARDENVSQHNNLRDANALTLRTLLALQSKSYHDFDAYLQFNNVSTANNYNYNSTLNGNTAYAIIPDPYHTSVNQAYIGYAGLPENYFKVGRQIINLDNQRFVGAVMFRQNIQNFNAASVTNQYFPNTTFFAAYTDWIDTVTTRVTVANDVLLNLKYHTDFLDIIPYAYLLEHFNRFNQPLLPQESTDTVGLRLNGQKKYNDITYTYTGEYAYQQSATNNPLIFDAYYYHLGLGGTWSVLSLNIDQEVLSGKAQTASNLAFRTPLATKHIFQGWADMFLTTPATGINDVFGTATVLLPAPVSGAKFIATYHNFDSQSTGTHFGREWDLALSKDFDKRYVLMIEYANFTSRDMPLLYPTTQKVWLTASASFS